MKIKVVKFGGSSLASGAGFLRVKNIIEADESRRFIVVSAPGRRYKDDEKVTDLLLASKNDKDAFQRAAERFRGIAAELDAFGMQQILAGEMDKIYKEYDLNPTEAYLASRGEYLNAFIMAALLKRTFIDAATIVRFGADGAPDNAKTKELIREALSGCERAVIPGFYGSNHLGEIRTFSRGGSDITGSLVAAALNADLYENWTDVSGVYEKDPRLHENPRRYRYIAYSDMRNLAEAGMTVLHPEALNPAEESRIPIRVKNSFRPNEEGTLISNGEYEELV